MIKKKILEKIIIKNRIPKNVEKSKKKVFIKELKRQIEPVYLYNFDNIIINGNGYPKIYKYQFIKDFLKFNSLSKFIFLKKIILMIIYFKKTINIKFFKKRKKNAILLHDRHSNNYFHWITDVIPKIIWAKNNQLLNNNFILIPTFKNSFQEESLKMISKKILMLDKNEKLFINSLKYISEFHPSGFPRPNSLIETKNFYLKKYSASYGADKIYISRRKSSRRKLKNEDELIKILLNNNFKVLDMEDFDFKKQVQISAKSKIMISTHGAGLTNLMWMKKQSSIIEIRDYKDDTLNPYFAMCGCLNIKYYCYFAKKNNLSNFTSHYDYEIDIKNFIKRFKKIICKN